MELLGGSLTCAFLLFAEDLSCKQTVELNESCFELQIEVLLVEEHFPNVLLKELVVRSLIVLQGPDSLDELLDAHEDWVRVGFGEFFLDLESFHPVILVHSPGNFFFVDEEHDRVAKRLQVVSSEAIETFEGVDGAVEDGTLEPANWLVDDVLLVFNE